MNAAGAVGLTHSTRKRGKMFLFFNLLSRFLPIPKVTARVALVVLVSASLLFAHMAHKRAVERTVTVAQEAVRIEYRAIAESW